MINQEYIPETWAVKKDSVRNAITGLEIGIEYSIECLETHLSALGENTSNHWLNRMRTDIKIMENALAALKSETNRG